MPSLMRRSFLFILVFILTLLSGSLASASPNLSAAFQSINISQADTVLLDHYENSTIASYASNPLSYVLGPAGYGQAANLTGGGFLRYDFPGWYEWSYDYSPNGKEGSVDFWVKPTILPTNLLNINWYNTNSAPPSGTIFHIDLDANGKIESGVWCAINGGPAVPLPSGSAMVPQLEWTHVAFSWGANGTAIYVNGALDAYTPSVIYPAFNPTNFAYVPQWGGTDKAYIDEFRLSRKALTAIQLSSPPGPLQSGTTFNVIISAGKTAGSIQNLNLDFTYDPTRYSVLGIQPIYQNGWSMIPTQVGPDKFNFSLAGPAPLPANGTDLIAVTLLVRDSGPQNTTFNLSACSLNGGSLPCISNSRKLTIAIPVDASFTATPVSGTVPLSVQFTNSSTGGFSNSSWDFGDGQTSTETNPLHIYQTAGAYTVKLTVSGVGGSDSLIRTDYIQVRNFDLSGRVTFWKDNLPVSGVSLALSGDQTRSVTNSDTGIFTLQDVPPGTYTLTPSKTGDLSGISAYDASLVLRHAAQAAPLTGPAAAAADVDTSGEIDEQDALSILEKVVGKNTGAFNGASSMWLFTPPNRAFAPLTADQLDQNFTAIELGDPSGSWVAPSVSSESPLTAAFTQLPPNLDRTVAVQLTLTPAGDPVYGVEMNLSFVNAKAAFKNLALQSPTGWLVDAKVVSPGVLKIVLAGSTPLPAEGKTILLTFQLADLSTPTALSLSSGMVNEDRAVTPTTTELGGSLIFLPVTIKP